MKYWIFIISVMSYCITPHNVDAQKDDKIKSLWMKEFTLSEFSEARHYYGLMQDAQKFELWLSQSYVKRHGLMRIKDHVYILRQIENNPFTLYIYRDSLLEATMGFKEIEKGLSGFIKKGNQDILITASTHDISPKRTLRIKQSDEAVQYEVRGPFINFLYTFDRKHNFYVYLKNKKDKIHTIERSINYPKSSSSEIIKFKRNQTLSNINIKLNSIENSEKPWTLRYSLVPKKLETFTTSFLESSFPDYNENFLLQHQYFIPTYKDETWICGIMQTFDGNNTLYESINYNIKSEKALKWEEVFKEIADFEDLINSKLSSLKDNCPDDIDCSQLKSIDEWSVSPYGIYVQLVGGIHHCGIIIPYSKIENINKWFSPINYIIKNGNK